MKKVLLTFCSSVLCLFVWQNSSFAIKTDTGIWKWWGYNGETSSAGSSQELIIDGGLWKNNTHGTHADEWGFVAMIATKVVEHGAYFCPYQAQCSNSRKEKHAWTTYYLPNGFSEDKCAWLCESGYEGEDCKEQSEQPPYCDKTPYNTKNGGKFSGLSMKTWGGDAGSVEGNVHGFNTWNTGNKMEHDVFLGVIKFLEHGVMASPIHVQCGRDNWKDNDSYFDVVDTAPGTVKLLCAPGYTPNAANTDCEPKNKGICEIQDIKMCDGFARDKYNSSIHTIKVVDGCAKYFCSETGKAFVSATDTTCSDCATGSKGGASGKDGTCVKCETGQYFNTDTSTCETATAFSKTDLQYGKGKTKNSDSDINNQCWTFVEPELYRDCVLGKLKTAIDAAGRVSLGGTLNLK